MEPSDGGLDLCAGGLFMLRAPPVFALVHESLKSSQKRIDLNILP